MPLIISVETRTSLRVKKSFELPPISEKLRLGIARKVQKGGKYVTSEDVEKARKHGDTDKEIHDTVLVAPSFCMFNRYVEGLGTGAPPSQRSIE